VKFIYFGAIIPATSKNATEWLPFWIYLAIIPTAVLGSHLAKHILNRISDKQFYQATQWLLWLVGVIYLVKAALLAKGGA
jgi:uncharacterized membrane protein YfcA